MSCGRGSRSGVSKVESKSVMTGKAGLNRESTRFRGVGSSNGQEDR